MGLAPGLGVESRMLVYEALMNNVRFGAARPGHWSVVSGHWMALALALVE